MNGVSEFIAAQMLEMSGKDWRIKPVDAQREDKYKADMAFTRFIQHTDDQYFATGFVYNDSRSLFLDGDSVRTSLVKDVFEVDGEVFIETRNTIYRVINTGEEQDA